MFAASQGPALSITGVTKAHATRAVKWMHGRSFLAFYRASDHSLNAFEFKQGRDWTYELMEKALRETRQ